MTLTIAFAFFFVWFGIISVQESQLSEWSTWGTWGTCNATCGGGFKVRTRNCQKPKGGIDCNGVGMETNVCNRIQCRKPFVSVSSHWGEWLEWTACSLKGSVINLRTRTCYTTFSDLTVPNCLGSSFEIKDEEWPECSVVGTWSVWSMWSSQSMTCSSLGYVNLVRSRTCQGQIVKGMPLTCSGRSREKKRINLPVCHQWSPWGEWILYESFCIRVRECKPSAGHCPGPYKQGTYCTRTTQSTPRQDDEKLQPSSDSAEIPFGCNSGDT